MYRLIKRISRRSSSSNGKKYTGYIYIYTQCWYFSYTCPIHKILFYCIYYYYNKELGQQ